MFRVSVLARVGKFAACGRKMDGYQELKKKVCLETGSMHTVRISCLFHAAIQKGMMGLRLTNPQVTSKVTFSVLLLYIHTEYLVVLSLSGTSIQPSAYKNQESHMPKSAVGPTCTGVGAW